jgi:HK97 family phage major capsid protein
MSNELLEKVTTTSVVGAGGGGLLNAEQSDRFIDYIWDATVLAQEGFVKRMKADTVDIDKVAVGQRLARQATEAVDDGVNAVPTFTKISITTKKLRLDWEVSTESVEDALESGIQDHIARLMATQFGNDIEDLAINGDDVSVDPLLGAFDGFKKLALTNGHVVAGAGAALDKAIFNSAIKAMPRKYLQRRNQLRFYTGSNLQQDWLYKLTDISTAPESIAEAILSGNPSAPGGTVRPYAFGIPVKEVPLFDETLDGTYSGATGDHGHVELTFPENRIWGIKREVKVYSDFAMKKDTTEFVAYVRVGVQIENADAFVIVKDVKVSV